MLYLAPVFLLVIAYVFGELILGLAGDKKANAAEKCIVGTSAMLVIFEVLFLVASRNGITFHTLCNVYSIVLLIIIIGGMIITRGKLYRRLLVKNPVNIKACSHVLFILVIQAICFFVFMPDTTLDFTVETVNTTVLTDTIYKYHPGTGELFNTELSGRGKVINLPIFYSYVYSLFGGNTSCFIYRAVPFWCLALSFMCYGLWANYLFNKSENKADKISLFLAGLGLLNMCGMFSKNCVFYNQMFRGFRGETICFTVLLPYCVYCIFYMLNTRTNRKWFYIILSLSAELFIADYEKGFVPTVFCVVMCVVIHQVSRLWRWIKCRK